MRAPDFVDKFSYGVMAREYVWLVWILGVIGCLEVTVKLEMPSPHVGIKSMHTWGEGRVRGQEERSDVVISSQAL